MAPRTRNNPNLRRRIAHLRMTFPRQHQSSMRHKPRTLREQIDLLNWKLLPLYPQPYGPPHPKFPKTILHWLLLTEDELDDIAHYYCQSTPGPYTNDYPAPMGWDADFLARSDSNTPQLMPWDKAWLAQFGWAVSDSTPSQPEPKTATGDAPLSAQHHAQVAAQRRQIETPDMGSALHRRPDNTITPLETRTPRPEDLFPPSPTTPPLLSTAERIAIKRRKLGKFMGLRGCETPVEEMHLRIRFLEAKLERGLRRAATRRDSTGGSGSARKRSGPRIGKDLL